MCKCRSHGTFPLFGLQSSHLNICYYHQDLHRRPLRPGSRPRFCGDRRALLLIGAWRLPRRPGVSAQLGTVTRLPVHPASPVLLTKNGPLGALDSVARLNEAAAPSYLFKYRCGPPPEFPLASPRSGIVHHLSGPDRHARTRTLLRRSRSVGGATPRGIPPVSFLAPYGFDRPLTRTHVRLLGPCFKTGRMGSSQADAGSAQLPKHAGTARAARHDRVDGVSSGVSTARALAAAAIRVGPRPEPIGGPACDRSTSDRGASPAPIRFPPDNFKHSLTLFSKSFSSFPRGTCLLSVSRPYLALDRIYRPIGAAFPNNPTRRQRLVVRQGPGTTGLSPSPAPPSSGLGPGPPLRTLLQTTIRTPTAPDSQAGLFPREQRASRAARSATKAHNWQPRFDDHRLSWRSSPRTRHLCQPRGVTHGRPSSAPPDLPRDARGGQRRVTPRQACPRPDGFGRNLRSKLDGSRDSAIHTKFDNDPSAGSPTETLLRLLLPLNDKVQWTSRDVAGSEPPTSPRSEHFTGPFNR
ncbi:hypothetical protein DVH24_030422 [Malus domestica]|uniref:Protein TAR1 n=1 Tax=Malus domestica TaxID=3750 RepID=A0A498KW44_MALDO|nr:hypothetical protein DVH24_030422 [Malus domestica]